jgi:hypothetical protein
VGGATPLHPQRGRQEKRGRRPAQSRNKSCLLQVRGYTTHCTVDWLLHYAFSQCCEDAEADNLSQDAYLLQMQQREDQVVQVVSTTWCPSVVSCLYYCRSADTQYTALWTGYGIMHSANVARTLKQIIRVKEMIQMQLWSPAYCRSEDT